MTVIRKYWQIDYEILTMLAEGDKRVTEISNGCLINWLTACRHLELMQSHMDVNESQKLWSITDKGRKVLAQLKKKAAKEGKK